MNLSMDECKRDLLLFFALTFGLSWAVWIPMVMASRGLLPVQFHHLLKDLAAFAPSIAAVIVTGRRGGSAQVSQLLSRLWAWRVSVVWYGLALCGSTVLGLVAIGLSSLFGGLSPNFAQLRYWPLIPLAFLWVLVTSGPLGEELGWRGYALQPLLDRHGRNNASLILGIVWSSWHLPLFWLTGTPQASLPFGWFLIQTTGMTFIYTWLYQRTQRSVLLAMLFHAANNTAAGFLPLLPVAASGGSLLTYALLTGLTWLVAIILMVAGPRGEWVPVGGSLRPRV